MGKYGEGDRAGAPSGQAQREGGREGGGSLKNRMRPSGAIQENIYASGGRERKETSL